MYAAVAVEHWAPPPHATLKKKCIPKGNEAYDSTARDVAMDDDIGKNSAPFVEEDSPTVDATAPKPPTRDAADIVETLLGEYLKTNKKRMTNMRPCPVMWNAKLLRQLGVKEAEESTVREYLTALGVRCQEVKGGTGRPTRHQAVAHMSRNNIEIIQYLYLLKDAKANNRYSELASHFNSLWKLLERSASADDKEKSAVVELKKEFHKTDASPTDPSFIKVFCALRSCFITKSTADASNKNMWAYGSQQLVRFITCLYSDDGVSVPPNMPTCVQILADATTQAELQFRRRFKSVISGSDALTSYLKLPP